MSTTKDQKGQTLILMLIVTVVSLTIGVAISSRAVSTLKQTSYTAQAGKAQKFADAGVEEALGTDDLSTILGAHTIDVDGDGNPDTTYTVAESGNAESVELQLGKDESYQLDLTSTSLTGLEVRWSLKGGNKDAIITYSVIHKDSSGNVTIQQKGASDPTESGADLCNLPLNSSDPVVSFTDPDYDYKITISGLSVNPVAGEELYIRVRPLCQDNVDTKITALPTGVDLPNQGYKITSTGTYGEAEWTAEVTKMNPALPSIFDFAIFSNTSLTK